ncbi:enoyl-CoA hydratase/isomerase family protein [Siculibacillus lacustris]|uniref:3-hydroxyisobutyryl-CoA hydrolase n=1 Tax=Siculibacillus lacustris TaxID=1549641 RepID=A0A4Q9VU89_9HYPH|nr:enoyl-CoA hydratase/isomerase family protein [Siculibacillus lacustris]TBW39732.1 enoyl-CoA hydratase/isomerase family protein [Siculibacillus lacustris]
MSGEFSTDEIKFERRGRAGVVILDRPKALNALNRAMVRAMKAQLDAWVVDPNIGQVLLTSTSEKAFCAGGDIRRIHDMGRAGEPDLTGFFFDEYQLDLAIHRCPKPFVSLIDGICMGGGIGLSMHAPFRVGSEKALFAMPEVTIGFFPDVGGAHVLAHLPGETGIYLAMTGGRVKCADAAALGLLTHVVASAQMGDLAAALTTTHDVAATITAFTGPIPGETPIADRRATIDRLFSGDDAPTILARLDAESGPDADWAHATAAEIRTKSPTSVALALHQVRVARDLDVEACLVLDGRIVSHILQGHDFYEGVRSVLVDRDNRPNWQPATFEEIAPGAIEAHLTTIPAGGDIVFPPSR